MFLVDFDRKFSESKRDDFIKINDDKHSAYGFDYENDDENEKSHQKNL
jgi:hypothetical protein